jgi:hypothetical protein
MANQGVYTGALAIIKVKGTAVGLMKNISINEDEERVSIYGLGTIIPSEAPVVRWAGTLTCSFWEIGYAESGIPGAIRRDVGVGNTTSQIASGINTPNFEDQLVLDSDGVEVDIFKKGEDVIDPSTGLINPKAVPYAIVGRCLIKSDNVTIDEGQPSGRSQTFVYLDPVVYTPGTVA